MEFDQDEVAKMILELNPSLQEANNAKHIDRNWQLLRNESTTRPSAKPSVRVKTPTLYAFEKHLGFTYRSFDGASWNTEKRSVNIEARASLTPCQSEMRDKLNTLLNYSGSTKTFRWHNIMNKKLIDTAYALLCMDTRYALMIGDSVYECSTRTPSKDGNYSTLTFSTRLEPLVTLTTIDAQIDALM